MIVMTSTTITPISAALARGESDLAAGRYTDLASARDIGGFLDEIDAEAAPDEPS